MNLSLVARPVAVIASTVLLTVLSAPSAQADTVWTAGSLSGRPSLEGDTVGPVYGFPEDGRPCEDGEPLESSVIVKTYGDYVFVKDPCRDGRSAIAMISGNEAGHFHKRICRNAEGVGTWVRCNYNWPEDTTKNVVAGSYDGSMKDMYLYYGAGQTFREYDGNCLPNSDGKFCSN